MRVLVIGGNGFIGKPLVRELSAVGHEIAILHRSSAVNNAAAGITQIQADRNRLAASEDALHRFAPDVIVDMILSSGVQAHQLAEVANRICPRVVAISTMDVYRAWGVIHGVEPGPLERLPLTEDSPLRSSRALYQPAVLERLQSVFSWVTMDYDKIAVEEILLGTPSLKPTVLRLPMVYGPGDPLSSGASPMDGRQCSSQKTMRHGVARAGTSKMLPMRSPWLQPRSELLEGSTTSAISRASRNWTGGSRSRDKRNGMAGSPFYREAKLLRICSRTETALNISMSALNGFDPSWDMRSPSQVLTRSGARLPGSRRIRRSNPSLRLCLTMPLRMRRWRTQPSCHFMKSSRPRPNPSPAALQT
jgi:hypothetical protein